MLPSSKTQIKIDRIGKVWPNGTLNGRLRFGCWRRNKITTKEIKAKTVSDPTLAIKARLRRLTKPAKAAARIPLIHRARFGLWWRSSNLAQALGNRPPRLIAIVTFAPAYTKAYTTAMIPRIAPAETICAVKVWPFNKRTVAMASETFRSL